MRTPSSGGDPEYTLRLAGRRSPACSADRRRRGVSDLSPAVRLALAGACCLADGALAAALALTTGHIGTRQQFGRPLATFQAAAQHIADVYIAARTLHLATLSACWRLAAGQDAGPDLDVAAYWLAAHGARGPADLPPPARRDRHGRQLPAAPLLRAGQGPGPVRRRRRLPRWTSSAPG